MEYTFPEDIDFPDDNMAPLAMAIGGMILSWGTVEVSLNISIAVLFNSAGGKHHADKNEVPVAMGRKLKFLRLCFKKIEALVSFRNDGLALCQRAGLLADKRNDIIHGYVSEYDSKTEKFTFTTLGSDKDVPLIKGQPKYTIHEIMEIGGACITLGSDFADFAKRLTNKFVG